VPYDPDLVPGLEAFVGLVEIIPLRADTILANRAHFATIIPPIEQQAAGRAVTWENRVIPGPVGAPDVEITIVRPRDAATRPAPGVLSIHGGGMVLGTRFFGTPELIDLAERYGAVGVAVEYRLAPEHPGPAQAEDCYAALEWMAAHTAELGIDPDRIIASGASAGGGLSAAVALMSRDRGGPRLAGQLLACPMIDDRNETVSSHQIDGVGVWDRTSNFTGWNALLGERRGTDDVSIYASPSRAADLGGLPPAFIDVGTVEVFRDEAVAYASQIWADGGVAELHVWPGGFHGFDMMAPHTAVAQAMTAARTAWVARLLGA
jgi:acetyl esterase/lipase